MLNTVPGISFAEGLPDPDDLKQNPEIPRLFVLDDLMTGGMENKEVSGMFTEGSHHHNFSVCFIVQNLFYGGKMQRNISLNCQYMAVFKNPRERYQISVLSRQVYPNASHKLLKAYELATDRAHGYLFIDFKQDTPEDQRLVKSLFQDHTSDSTQLRCLHNSQLRCRTDNTRQSCDESVWNAYYNRAIENLPHDASDDDIIKEIMEMYIHTLLKIYSMQKSDRHHTMMNEFLQLSHSFPPEEAAKRVVCKNHKLFEDVVVDDESSDEESL